MGTSLGIHALTRTTYVRRACPSVRALSAKFRVTIALSLIQGCEGREVLLRFVLLPVYATKRRVLLEGNCTLMDADHRNRGCNMLTIVEIRASNHKFNVPV